MLPCAFGGEAERAAVEEEARQRALAAGFRLQVLHEEGRAEIITQTETMSRGDAAVLTVTLHESYQEALSRCHSLPKSRRAEAIGLAMATTARDLGYDTFVIIQSPALDGERERRISVLAHVNRNHCAAVLCIETTTVLVMRL